MENKSFATYEYMSKTVRTSEQTSTIDTYEAFGWEATETTPAGLSGITISFKRDRKVLHKTELNRLERKVDTIKENLVRLNAAKTKGASIFAYSFGIFAALVFGGGMCMTMLITGNLPAMIGGIILGLAGIALCGLNYLFYRKITDKKTKEMVPVIEDNEEKLAIVCEQAHGLLTNAEL